MDFNNGNNGNNYNIRNQGNPNGQNQDQTESIFSSLPANSVPGVAAAAVSENAGTATGKSGLSAQQVITYLMRMDAEQRNTVIAKNPQLRAFLVQIEQQRRFQLQRMQQSQNANISGQVHIPNQSQPQSLQDHGLSQAQIQAQAQAQKREPEQEQHQSQSQFQFQQQQYQAQTPNQNISIPFQNNSIPQENSIPSFKMHQNNLMSQNSPENSVNSNIHQKSPEYSALLKEKIPRKPLQKKGMKKKALSGGPSSTAINSEKIAATSVIPSTFQHNLETKNNPNMPSQEGELVYNPNGPLNSQLDLQNSVDTVGPPNILQHLITKVEEGARKSITDDIDASILSSPHEWSQRLIKEGTEPSMDLKLYENIIFKDTEYLKYTSLVNKATKESENNINDKVGVNGKLFERIFKDLKFYQQVKAARMHSMKLQSEYNELTSSMWGDGYSGYGNGFTNGKIDLVFPKDSKMDYNDDIFLNVHNEKLFEKADYIPIRLEFDVDRDGFKLNDTFVWNANDDDETLKILIEEIVKDYRIENNASNVSHKIFASIKEQIADFHPMVINPNIDLRFPINLDITISNNQLVDRFDWDIMNQENNPEEFAETLCEEFALPNEFKSAISHSIREQCQIYLKSLFMIGYKFDGATIISEDLKEFLRSGFEQNNVMMPRYLLSDFTPYVQELSIDNFEKIIKERERESRRKKRGATRVGRRGGFVLPDLHNMPKTFRTPLPNTLFPGSVSLADDNNNVDDYIDTPIDIDIPAEQLRRLREHETQIKHAWEVIAREKLVVKGWITKTRGRRIRGETLSATVNIIDSEILGNNIFEKEGVNTEVKVENQTDDKEGEIQSQKQPNEYLLKRKKTQANSLNVKIGFVFR